MKRLILLLLCIVFVSCSKDNVNTLQDDVSQVLNLTGDSQKQAFSMLSPAQKRSIWHDKFNLILEESTLYGRKVTLNNQQLDLIESLKNILSEDFFAFESLASKEIQENHIEPWIKKAKKSFTREEFIEIFTSISYKSMVQSREVELDLDGNPASNKCKCSQKEDYCWFSDCESSDCESTYTGCGIAWGSPCDGRCN